MFSVHQPGNDSLRALLLEPGLPVLPGDVPTAGRGRTARDAELQVHRDAWDGDHGNEPGIEVVPALEAAGGHAGYDVSILRAR